MGLVYIVGIWHKCGYWFLMHIRWQMNERNTDSSLRSE